MANSNRWLRLYGSVYGFESLLIFNYRLVCSQFTPLPSFTDTLVVSRSKVNLDLNDMNHMSIEELKGKVDNAIGQVLHFNNLLIYTLLNVPLLYIFFSYLILFLKLLDCFCICY